MKYTKKLSVVLTVLMLTMMMFAFSVTADAATNAQLAKKKYNRFIATHKLASSVIVDIDNNGIPELLCFSNETLKALVYTYDASSKKMILLCSLSSGKGYGSYYSVKNKKVVLCSSSTGGSKWYVYTISGKRATLVKKCISTRKSIGKYSYQINSRSVLQKTWDATINPIRKYSYFRGLMG